MTADNTSSPFTCELGGPRGADVAHYLAMCLSARFKFTATLLVALLGFVVTLDTPGGSLLEEPLAMQTPQR